MTVLRLLVKKPDCYSFMIIIEKKMKKIFLNLQINNIKQYAWNSFFKTPLNSFSVLCVGSNSLCAVKNEINWNTLRCLHSSSRKFKHIDENPNEKPVIYYGTLTGRIKGVKVFSFITSIGGIVGQAWILQNSTVINNLPVQTSLLVCLGFFTYITPILINSLSKKYVTEIRYDSTNDIYTATLLSFFLRNVYINFKKEDVTIPTYQGFFTNMVIKGRPVLVSSDCFFDVQDYIKMMGYDKPIDLQMSPDNSQKTTGGS